MEEITITEEVYPKSYEVHENCVAINLCLDSVSPDRVQYKPYGLSWSSSGLYVQVIVPKEQVVKLTTECVILTPKGAAVVADQLATAIDEIHNAFRGRDKTF